MSPFLLFNLYHRQLYQKNKKNTSRLNHLITASVNHNLYIFEALLFTRILACRIKIHCFTRYDCRNRMFVNHLLFPILFGVSRRPTAVQPIVEDPFRTTAAGLRENPRSSFPCQGQSAQPVLRLGRGGAGRTKLLIELH